MNEAFLAIVAAGLSSVVPLGSASMGRYGRWKVNPSCGKAVSVWARSDEAYRILDSDPQTMGSTWWTGGCLVLALALRDLLPKGNLVAIAGRHGVDHVALKLGDDQYLDADGLSTGRRFLVRFRERENMPEASILDSVFLRGGHYVRRDIEAAARIRGIPAPLGVVAATAEALKDQFARISGLCWSG